MAKSKKYYVVWEGDRPGIYSSWSECKAQIAGYPGAKYKAFKTRPEAERAYKSSFADHIQHKAPRVLPERNLEGVIWKSISVDAACSGNPGIMEYRGVDTRTKEEIFRQGPYKYGTNNIGEFLGLVHALALLKREGKHDLPVYSDSRTAMAWLRNKKVKTTLKKNRYNAKLFDMMDRAIRWLESNSYENPVHKWNTKAWGEIPADFGRK